MIALHNIFTSVRIDTDTLRVAYNFKAMGYGVSLVDNKLYFNTGGEAQPVLPADYAFFLSDFYYNKYDIKHTEEWLQANVNTYLSVEV